MLQATTHFRRHQRCQYAGGIVDYGDGFAGAAEVHRQLAADQPAADNQHPFGIAQRTLCRAKFLLAVEGQHQFFARHRRNDCRRAGGQDQFVVPPFMVLTFDHVRLSVDVGYPGLREQVQVVLFGKLAGGLQGEVGGGLPPAHYVA